ncbi:MAG: hypothetical protein ACR2QS_06355 [Woeseiaceae bacterium]
MNMHALLKKKSLNGWYLFWLISAPISALVMIELFSTDVSTGSGVSHMIGYSVRFAVPLIFIVTAASALQTLFPSAASGWLLRNRKYIGLSFAVSMAWQGLFIFTMSMFFRDYYYEDVYLLRDEIEGSVGYLFLAAMVVTSFRFGRRHLSQRQWKLLHTSGVYFLWAYPFSTYWWTVAGYYGEIDNSAIVFYWAGFLAFAARIAAWGKQRMQSVAKDSSLESSSLSARIIGGMFIGVGLYASATVAYWQQPVSAWLTAQDWSANMSLWLAYWPFEPFLALMTIGLGTMIVSGARRKQRVAVAV